MSHIKTTVADTSISRSIVFQLFTQLKFTSVQNFHIRIHKASSHFIIGRIFLLNFVHGRGGRNRGGRNGPKKVGRSEKWREKVGRKRKVGSGEN